jgi:hypothetical protein
MGQECLVREPLQFSCFFFLLFILLIINSNQLGWGRGFGCGSCTYPSPFSPLEFFLLFHVFVSKLIPIYKKLGAGMIRVIPSFFVLFIYQAKANDTNK